MIQQRNASPEQRHREAEPKETSKLRSCAVLTALLLSACGDSDNSVAVRNAYKKALHLAEFSAKAVDGDSFEPRWASDGKHLWYSVRYVGREFVSLVDLESGGQEPLVDPQRIKRAILAKGLLKEADFKMSFMPWSVKLSRQRDPSSVAITIAGKRWDLRRSDYEISPHKITTFAPVVETSSQDATPKIQITLSNAADSLAYITGASARREFWELKPKTSQKIDIVAGAPLVAIFASSGGTMDSRGPLTAGIAGSVLTFSKNLPAASDDEARKIANGMDLPNFVPAAGNGVEFKRAGKDAWFEIDKGPDQPPVKVPVPEYAVETFYPQISRSPTGESVIGVGFDVPSMSRSMLSKNLHLRVGESLPQPRLALLQFKGYQALTIDHKLFPNFALSGAKLEIIWAPDGNTAYFTYIDRSHQLHREIAIDTASGKTRVVAEERSESFVSGDGKQWRQHLHASHELVWLSRRDGWDHLYLYDSAKGKLQHQITRGEWVVRSVIAIDEQERTVWFMASGLVPGQNPYQQHLCRINLDGTGFVQLTDEDADHQVSLSPDRRWFIDSRSRPDQPPVTDLCKAQDGKSVATLVRASVQRAKAAGWQAPERFVAKGRDGETDIWGLIFKPAAFDALRKYPVIEHVYGGPQTNRANAGFRIESELQALAAMGFVVVVSDGMGSNFRGRKFQDVAHRNLTDGGFPDRIQWIKQAAISRPWMDLSRVGIEGVSSGGYFATRALMDHANFYDAALSDCGCHDVRWVASSNYDRWLNRMDTAEYKPQSNLSNAAKLQGHLMLLAGGKDPTVPISLHSAMVTSLQSTNKNFESVVVPGGGHGVMSSRPGRTSRLQFFARRLLGIDLTQP